MKTVPMKTIDIQLHGCDDCNSFEMEMTQQQYEFLQKVSALTHEHSSISCQPVIKLRDTEELIF